MSGHRKYLIDIVHPHFVHFFKIIILKLGKESVIVTCQDSGIITTLLKGLSCDYIIIGKKYSTLIKKAFGQILYFKRYLNILRTNQITHVLGTSPSIALAAKLVGLKMYFFDDDDSAVQLLTKKITIPLADYIITPKCLEFENYGKRHYTYKGYQELAYLSPKYFTPKKGILSKYNLIGYQYFIVRFNDFIAHHDTGHSGIPDKTKVELIKLLEKYGDVFITSESPLKDEFSKYQLIIDPIDIHDILAFARMYVGDSQTMTSESAVLGTPAIRCNSFKNKISYLTSLEKDYSLTFSFDTNESSLMLDKIKELLSEGDISAIFNERRNKMLSEMEDVNIFILKLLNSA